MKKRPLVYVASPYSQGNVEWNVSFQCGMFHQLRDDDVVVPIMPLWSHFQDAIYHRPYEDWMDYDFALLARCDAILRLDAKNEAKGYFQHESGGADREVEHMRKMGRPVFFELADLYYWAVRFRNVKTMFVFDEAAPVDELKQGRLDAFFEQFDDPKKSLEAHQQQRGVQEPAC